MRSSSLITSALLLTLFLNACLGDIPSNLCHVPACSCYPNRNSSSEGLLDVSCQCQGQQDLIIGDPSENVGATIPPANTVSIRLQGCHRVEFLSKVLNVLPRLKTLVINATEKLVMQSMIYDSRIGTGESIHLKTVEIIDVRLLQVARQTFEGISVDGEFLLRDVYMPKVPSLAFKFDHVNEFSIFSSRLDRVSMWGFKIEMCGSFNVLGMSRFFSLASQAFFLRCNKFMLAYNVFVSLRESSFDVRFVFMDIQGNTFESLTGKPFIDLRPVPQSELKSIDSNWNITGGTGAGGFVFRENKFSAAPSLPFGSLVIPAFSQIDPEVAYVDIDMNHFLCECNKLDWFIGAVAYNFDTDAIAAIGNNKQGFGAMTFLQHLYDTSGNCLGCSVTTCNIDSSKSFVEFATQAMEVRGNDLKCKLSGKLLATSPMTPTLGPSSYEYEPGGSVDTLRRPTHPPTIRTPTRDESDNSREINNIDFDKNASRSPRVSAILTMSILMLVMLFN